MICYYRRGLSFNFRGFTSSKWRVQFLKEVEPLSGSLWILWKTINFEFTTQTHIPIMKIGFKNRHWEIFVFYVTELWNFYGLRNTLSVQLYSYLTSVTSVFVSDKIVNNGDYFRIKCLFYSKCNFMCSLFSVFIFFYTILEKCQNFIFLVIFDTCDVVYYWSISLLPPKRINNIQFLLGCHQLYLIIYLP